MMHDLFFAASKLVVPLLDPSTWLLLMSTLGLWFIWRRRLTGAAWSVGLTVLVAFFAFKMPTGAVLVRPLEQAIRPPVTLPAHIDGIVTLAGFIDPTMTEIYENPQLSAEAERATEFVALARRYPTAKLVFAGDTGFLAPDRISEAEAMRRFLVGQGIDPARVVFESKSRNTHESAVNARSLLQPKPGESWLLITSAVHMPRAYGTFRKSGWELIPYPVSYLARPTFSFHDGSYGLVVAGINEWIGIAVYRITGRM